MHLQLQQQQPHRRQDNRTGFEVLLDQATTETSSSGGASTSTTWSPDVGAAWSPGSGTAWSPSADTNAGRYHHHQVHHYHHDRPNGLVADSENGWPRKPSDATTPDSIDFVDEDGCNSPTAATTPLPTSPLSLPSPYYDRNPIIGFPLHNHHHQHHHSSKSPVTATTAAATVPLANVQNVVHAGIDQDHHDHYANNSKVRSLNRFFDRAIY